MAEERRLTKKERREKRRRERQREEAAEQRQERRRRMLAIGGTAVAIAGIVALIVFTGGSSGETGIVIDPAEAQQASQSAGCTTPQVPAQSGAADHINPAEAPPASQLYPVRPTASGPHFPTQHPTGVYDDPIDERATTHSLEHGGVIVWYVPDAVDGQTVSQIEDWANGRNSAGFNVNPRFGAGIIAAPFPDGTSTGNPVALRAWGVAVDCAQFNETVADSFLINNFASHGQSPEGGGIAYPEDVLSFSEGDQSPATDGQSPAGGEQTSGETQGGGQESPADGADSPAGSPAG